MTREQGTGNREVLGNFTFLYLCRFFSAHLLKNINDPVKHHLLTSYLCVLCASVVRFIRQLKHKTQLQKNGNFKY
ncbi:MAG: hypothetical protein ACK5UF_09220 [Dolichospermum sp.]